MSERQGKLAAGCRSTLGAGIDVATHAAMKPVVIDGCSASCPQLIFGLQHYTAQNKYVLVNRFKDPTKL